MAYKSVDSSNQFEVLQKLRNIRQDHKTFFYLSAWTIEKKVISLICLQMKFTPIKQKLEKSMVLQFLARVASIHTI